MAWVPIVPIINNGMGWGFGRRMPPEECPCYMYYQRKEGDTTFRFKRYYDELKSAKPSVERDGKTFYAYAVEQDGYKERLEYDSLRDKCKYTGEIF